MHSYEYLIFSDKTISTIGTTLTVTNKLTKQLEEVKCYEIIEVRITKYMTQKLLKTTEFTEIS